MNKRIKNIVTVVLLAAFLFGFGAWAALKPADSLSLSERRRLKQLPAVRMDAVLSGKFMSDFEGYALDQFPLCATSGARSRRSTGSTSTGRRTTTAFISRTAMPQSSNIR